MRTEEQIIVKRDFKIRELDGLKQSKKGLLSQSDPEQSNEIDMLFDVLFDRLQREIDIYNWILINA